MKSSGLAVFFFLCCTSVTVVRVCLVCFPCIDQFCCLLVCWRPQRPGSKRHLRNLWSICKSYFQQPQCRDLGELYVRVQCVVVSAEPRVHVLPLWPIVWTPVILFHMTIHMSALSWQEACCWSWISHHPTCWDLDYQENPFPSLGRDTGAGVGSRGAEWRRKCHCGGLGLGHGGQERLSGKGVDAIMSIILHIL